MHLPNGHDNLTWPNRLFCDMWHTKIECKIVLRLVVHASGEIREVCKDNFPKKQRRFPRELRPAHPSFPRSGRSRLNILRAFGQIDDLDVDAISRQMPRFFTQEEAFQTQAMSDGKHVSLTLPKSVTMRGAYLHRFLWQRPGLRDALSKPGDCMPSIPKYLSWTAVT